MTWQSNVATVEGERAVWRKRINVEVKEFNDDLMFVVYKNKMRDIIGKVNLKVSALTVPGGFEGHFAIKDEKTGIKVGNLYL